MSLRSQSEQQAALTEAQEQYSTAEMAYRQRRFLTDEELRNEFTDRAAAEKQAIREAVDAGRVYVVAGRVHHYDCSTLREQIDRDRAWSQWHQWDAETARRELAHGSGGPQMPTLVDRASVEARTTYITCQVCSPTLNHTKKVWKGKTTQLTTLSQRHIGRRLTALDGYDLGVLVRIVTTIDATSSVVHVETNTGSFTSCDHTRVVASAVDGGVEAAAGAD